MNTLYSRKISPWSFGLFSFAVVFISTAHFVPPPIPEIQETYWSSPQIIPGFDLGAWPPILIADQNRNVHAFSSQWLPVADETSVKAVVYNKWSLENGWTEPVDILLSPVKEARVTDAYLDNNGIMHIVFWGGDGTDANIYYSKAPVTNADNAHSWTTPVVIGENAGDPEGAVLAENDDGILYVIYNGQKDGKGLYVVKSLDRGETWSKFTPMFFTDSDEPNIFQLHVTKGSSGSLHAVWNVYTVDGQGRGIYYSRSADGDQWNEPIMLVAAQEGLGTQTPTIVEYKDDLIVLFNLPPKIMMRRSNDDGKTWTNSSIIFPRHVGVNGSLSPVIDGSEVLHLLFGQRISGSPDIHGMWHSIMINDHWTEPDALIKGPQVNDQVGNRAFDPYEARAVVSQGNVILTTWRADPGLKGNGVWYSYKVLNTPELPLPPTTIQTSQDFGITPMRTDSIDSPEISTPVDPIENQSLLVNQYSPSLVWNSGTFVAVGAIAAIVLILILVIIKILQNR